MAGQPILPLLVPLFLARLGFPLSDCQFNTMVDRFAPFEGDRDVFFKQESVKKQSEIFKELVDSAIDMNEKGNHYFGFPYYLRITLHCARQDSARAMRKAHYSGLIPIVTIAFEEPVHAVRQKPEQLQIQMKAAPYRIEGNCNSEEVCNMRWYTPMPIVNGSVVMMVVVRSNNLGFPVGGKSIFMNINGYVRETGSGYEFPVGERITSLQGYMSLTDGSRPLWFTIKQAPVLILGGVPNQKVVLMSDTAFDDSSLMEVAIDSCWISSQKCPWDDFSSSIIDTISTESTLFVRQNQLIYYFTGNYSALYTNTSGSELWTRVLGKKCVRKLNPVPFPWNNTEYVIALGGGWQEGEFFLITVSDGIVKHAVSKRKSVCTVLGSFPELGSHLIKISHQQITEHGKLFDTRSAPWSIEPCELLWVIFAVEQNRFYLLVHTTLERNVSSYCIMVYHQATEHYEVVSFVPQFIPDTTDQGYVLLIGQEKYTDIPMVPRGLSYSPLSGIFFVWGNIILESNDLKNYMYLASFPSDSPIKYFVQSFVGHYAFVTDDEQVWISHEGSATVRRMYPSRAWNLHRSLQILGGSHNPSVRESLVSVFFDRADHLKELVYIVDARGNGRLVKREVPSRYVLAYSHVTEYPHRRFSHEGKDFIKFPYPCPFGRARIVGLPLPQRFDRREHYRAIPPDIMEKTGFHDKRSLTVYQGLVSQLLWLHSSYNRPYADPVHDPTWRWWKSQTEDAQYYSYVASNRMSSGGIYINMENFVKVYNLGPNNGLPGTIYLDKYNIYHFDVFFSVRTKEESLGDSAEENPLRAVWLTINVAHPEYVNVVMDRREMISRGAVFYQVRVADIGTYPRQDLSGKKLLNSLMIFSVCNAVTMCYDRMPQGPSLRGYKVLPVIIGCPPGRRLAFDITGTLQYMTRRNKRYFDCVNPDPDMPCFFFNDVFYPSFLVQDMVTGESGLFNGSYIFKIVGGGPYTKESIRYFSKDEILRYNTNNVSDSVGHIWLRAGTKENATDAEGFNILSRSDSGIVWVCQKESPCYDILPQDMLAPHYFFVVHVSNRGVDETTYCDYALEFIVHVHGLRLSPTRAIFLMKVSMSSVSSLVILYILIYILAPKARRIFFKAARHIKEAVVMRTESSITYSSSVTSRGSQNQLNTFSDGSTFSNSPAHQQNK